MCPRNADKLGYQLTLTMGYFESLKGCAQPLGRTRHMSRDSLEKWLCSLVRMGKENLNLQSIWGFSETGVPPNHPFVDGMFHYKPSIWGYPIYGNLHMNPNRVSAAAGAVLITRCRSK